MNQRFTCPKSLCNPSATTRLKSFLGIYNDVITIKRSQLYIICHRCLKEDKEAPKDWQGALNVKYYLGPNFKEPNWTVKMEVHTKNKMAKIHNTIGILRGKEEPGLKFEEFLFILIIISIIIITDRYVLVGNHRDAWILGAIDPSSGTASMLEIARALGKIKKDRSIINS